MKAISLAVDYDFIISIQFHRINYPINEHYSMLVTYIFLDIDGVLRKKTDPNNKLNDELTNILASSIDEENIQIVISSTWRIAYSLENLKQLFPESMRQFIASATPEHPNQNINFVRERECMAWLRANAITPSYYVAIDDDTDLFKYFPLIKIDPYKGIDLSIKGQIKATRKTFYKN
jgi:hypothetical protein